MNSKGKLYLIANESLLRADNPSDTGVFSLGSIIQYFGVAVNPPQLKDYKNSRFPGYTLLELHKTAESLGFNSNAYKADLKNLMALQLPVILHMLPESGVQTFMVCYGYDGSYFFLGNPTTGVNKIIPKKLLDIWKSKTLLMLEPGADFSEKISTTIKEFTRKTSMKLSERYILFDVKAYPTAADRVIIHSKRTGNSRIMSTQTAQVLLSYNSFKTIPEFTEMILSDFGVSTDKKSTGVTVPISGPGSNETRLDDKDTHEFMQQFFKEFAQEGFLVSDQEIQAELYDIFSRDISGNDYNSRITSLGIPSRARPEILKRALQSFLGNMRDYDRKIFIRVIDDSLDEKNITQNKGNISTLTRLYNIPIQHIKKANRIMLADKIAERGMISPEFVRFALYGDDRYRTTIGSARNSLLLLTVGEKSLQVDDDVVCKIAPSPDLKDGIALTSYPEPNEYWFFESHEKAIEFSNPGNNDFIGIYEQMLGKYFHTDSLNLTVKESLTITDRLQPEFLRHSKLEQARIGVSFLGCLGDAATDIHGNLSRLFLKGNSFERLSSSSAEYNTNKVTRQILRVPDKLTISDSPSCMTMNIGLDQSELIPPFMPVNRNGDGVFGCVLHACFPLTFKAYFPYSILHNPADARTHKVSVKNGVQSPRLNDFLCWLILSFKENIHGTSGRENLIALGHYLKEIGTLAEADFIPILNEIGFQTISNHLVQAEQKLKSKNSYEYWKNDLQEYIKTYYMRICRKDFFLPSDLKGSVKSKVRLARYSIRAYGELLIHWPDILEIAKELKENENYSTLFNSCNT